MAKVEWDIRNEGRAWDDEAMDRYFMQPETLEMVDGKRVASEEEERGTLFCLLLENVGANRAVQFGDPDVWRAAVAKLPK